MQDADAARIAGSTISIGAWSIALVSGLGTLGVDTKPFITGLGITGFTVGFALRDIATNHLSGMMLVFQRHFNKGDRLRVQIGGVALEGIVELIDVRYVQLRDQNQASILIPSSVVYANPMIITKLKQDDPPPDRS